MMPHRIESRPIVTPRAEFASERRSKNDRLHGDDREEVHT
jgi:hypothetical protein